LGSFATDEGFLGWNQAGIIKPERSILAGLAGLLEGFTETRIFRPKRKSKASLTSQTLRATLVWQVSFT
jgi:hypothetical protein